MKRIGVLLAAGRSERMGRPKQLLPWPPKSENSKPLVAAAFDAIARVCDEMVVVAGHYGEEVVLNLRERKFFRVNGDSGSELFPSIQFGLLAASRIDPSADILLHLADHPEVRRDTLEALIRTAGEKPNCAVMPKYRGQGGHPVLIPAALTTQILSSAGGGGLRQFWLDRPELCLRLPVDDPGVILDIDTQSDYDFRVQ